MSKKSSTEFIVDSHAIAKWAQKFWENHNVNQMRIDNTKESYYMLDMFPYPSGYSLHIGHPVGYIAGDVNARFMRMCGKNVLHCFGFDSFGLPAEQYAINTGQHPEITTKNNIANMEAQIKALGFMIDWDRKVVTSDPEYYKWTQWIFLKFYDHFFDHTEIWDDGFGNQVHGRAKHVSELERMLKNGEWSISMDGEPVSVPTMVQYTQAQIDEAINRARLVYLESVPVNWCPALGTVLSNEEVINGRSERGNHPVVIANQKQWMMRITKYAHRLSTGFEKLQWPESTVIMQKNWIGMSNGMEIDFEVNLGNITVYTTRPDTILGVTFIAAGKDKYPAIALKEGETGAFTGEYAIHPLTKSKIPIWVADYVIEGYGTGYVMGVPAHDIRDFSFAKQHNLEIKAALIPDDAWLVQQGLTLHEYLLQPYHNNEVYMGKSLVIAENGTMARDDFIQTIPGRPQKTMKLRDWIFSRQRYWGEPFPVVHCPETGKIYPIDDADLPVILPSMTDFKPIMSQVVATPLEKCADWINVEVEIVNGKAKLTNIDQTQAKIMQRNPNTMPNWAGSCWYYLRYIDPKNPYELCSREAYDYWCGNMPATICIGNDPCVRESRYCTVDTYIGGSEHAVLHLLYARFWHMFLFDIGVVRSPEPFYHLIHQGLVSAPSYFNPKTGQYVAPQDVQESDGSFYYGSEQLQVHKGKMGKSYKNGVECGQVVEKYGVGAFRLYLMYLGPLTDPKNDFKEEAIVGMVRFLRDIEYMAQNLSDVRVDYRFLNQLIYEVTKMYEDKTKLNTIIAKLIEFLNNYRMSKEDMIIYLQLLAPLEPHIAEYLYQKLAPGDSIFDTPWPEYDQELLNAMEVSLVINIKGKFKRAMQIDPNLSNEEIVELAGHVSSQYIIKRLEKQIMINFI